MIDTIYIGIMAYRMKESPLLIPDLIQFFKYNHRIDDNFDIISCEDATDVIMHQLFYVLDKTNPEADPEGKTRAEYGLMKLEIETHRPLKYQKLDILEENLKSYVKFYYEDDAGVYFPYLIKEAGRLKFTIPNILICGSQEDEDVNDDDFSYLQSRAEMVDLHLNHDFDITDVYPDAAAKLLLSSEFGQVR